jgi:hypothetical protein
MIVWEALRGLLALAMVAATGVSVLCWMKPPTWCARLRDRLALAHLVGLAVLTWTEVATASLTGHLSLAPVYAGVVCCVVFARSRVAAFLMQRPEVPATLAQASSRWRAAPATLLFVAIACTVAGTIWSSPLVSDAYANYALKARALFLAGTLAPLANDCCLHNGYPLLVPTQTWWVFEHIGRDSVRWIQILGLAYYFDGTILAFAFMRSKVSTTWALMGTAVIAADPVSSIGATLGMADPPLATYFLASAIFLEDFRREGKRSSWVILLLLLTGCLETKNEGMTWALFALLGLLLVDRTSIRWKRFAVSAGALFVAWLPWAWIKFHDKIPIPYFHMPVASMAEVVRMMGPRIPKMLRVYFLQPIIPFVWIYAFVLLPLSIWRTWGRKNPPSPVMLGLVAVQLASYFAVTLIAVDFGDILTFFERAISHLSPVLVVATLIACFQPRLEASNEGRNHRRTTPAANTQIRCAVAPTSPAGARTTSAGLQDRRSSYGES